MTLAAPPTRRASRSSKAKPRRPADRVLAVAPSWGEAHCIIPDGFRKGDAFRLYDWQARFLSAFYLVRGDAEWVPTAPVLGPAFRYARAGLVGPQKLGKDPLEAFHICIEGAGPALFAGWAGKDDGYACREHGCGCGWEYAYDPGEPMGMRWPTPLIQVTAVSEEATANTYSALRPMIDDGPLHDIIPKTSEQFIRLPGGGRIDVVTASARSRLGQRVTFVSQGEAGLYTKPSGMMDVADTQYRGLAGMGGRAAWHTNAWDPAQRSVAQREHEAREASVYVQFDRPPSGLSFTVRDERWRIYRSVYPREVLREHGGHVDLDSVDGEALRLLAHDPTQAARFFGNLIVSGGGRAFDLDRWKALARDGSGCDHARVTLGFDGSKSGDHTGLVATCVTCGWQWPVGIWRPEVRDEHGRIVIDRHAVDMAVDDVFTTRRVLRMLVDPYYWRDELASWQGRYGDKVVMPFDTNRRIPTAYMLRAFVDAIGDGTLTHSGDATYTDHIGNAYRRVLMERDTETGEHLWNIQKETPDSGNKIDAAMAGALSWRARTEAVAAGALTVPGPSIYESQDGLFVV